MTDLSVIMHVSCDYNLAIISASLSIRIAEQNACDSNNSVDTLKSLSLIMNVVLTHVLTRLCY